MSKTPNALLVSLLSCAGALLGELLNAWIAFHTPILADWSNYRAVNMALVAGIPGAILGALSIFVLAYAKVESFQSRVWTASAMGGAVMFSPYLVFALIMLFNSPENFMLVTLPLFWSLLLLVLGVRNANSAQK